jgi:ubiquinone biosynthesis protein Coq4
MDIKVFSPGELEAVLRALLVVATANDSFTHAERDFVETIAQLHGAEIDVDALRPLSGAELASIVRDPHRRKRAVQLAIILALVEGDIDGSTERAVHELAAALGIEEEGVKVLYDMSQGHTLIARVEMVRRVTRSIRTVDRFPGFFKTALQALGVAPEDHALAERYQALGELPEDSFGRAFFTHYRKNGFPLPGEKRGASAVVFHDMGHVLSGYDVDPQGEIQQAAFQAGFLRTDGFLFLLFGVLQFHLGVRITPIAKGQRGFFDVKRVLRAAERGAACKADLGHGFDLFEHASKPLEQLRRELGVPPL